MAATTSQGKSFALFMVGATVTSAGIAAIATGLGKLALVVGIVVLIVSCVNFFKIKPEEGKTARGAQPAVMKLAGVVVAVVGWLIVLFGIHMTAAVYGRLVLTLIGLAVSLCGILILLPAAANKNAIWKA